MDPKHFYSFLELLSTLIVFKSSFSLRGAKMNIELEEQRSVIDTTGRFLSTNTSNSNSANLRRGENEVNQGVSTTDFRGFENFAALLLLSIHGCRGIFPVAPLMILHL